MLPPPLETDSIVLSPFGRNHLTSEYLSWLNNPEVVRYSEQRHRTHSLESCQEFVRRFENGPDHLWAIEYGPEQLHVGNITTAVDVQNRIADIQILIGDREIWGMGVGTRAWQAVQTFLFQSGFRKVTGGTMAVNHGMLKIFEKSGMHIEGHKARHFLLDGQEVDLVMAASFN